MKKSLTFILCLLLSGCVSTISNTRYKLPEDQRNVVHGFTGYDKTTRDSAVWNCYKSAFGKDVIEEACFNWLMCVMTLPVYYAIVIPLSPLCLVVPSVRKQSSQSKREFRLAGELTTEIVDDSGNPRKNFDLILDGKPIKTSSAGEVRFPLYFNYYGHDEHFHTLNTADNRWQFISRDSGETSMSFDKGKKSGSTSASFEWGTSGDVASVIAKVGDVSIKDVSRLVVSDTLEPADLVTDVKFDDRKSVLPNGSLDAGENASLFVSVHNHGKGTALDTRLVIQCDQTAIEIEAERNLSNIPAGETWEGRIPLKAGLNLASGTALIKIAAKEQRGYDAKMRLIRLDTRRLQRPGMEIGQISVNASPCGQGSGNGNCIVKNGETFEMAVSINNTGIGDAKHVQTGIAIETPGIEVLTAPQNLGDIVPERPQTAKYQVRVPRNFNLESIRGTITATDVRGAQSVNYPFSLAVSRQVPGLDITYNTVYDGNSMRSKGNANGNIENGETVEVEIVPKNTGKMTAKDVVLTVSASDGLSPTPSRVELGELPPGNQADPQRFVITVPRTFKSSLLRLQFVMNQRDFDSARKTIEFPVHLLRPKLVITYHFTSTNGNETLQQGEDGDLVFTVENRGALDAIGVVLALEMKHQWVDLDATERRIGNLAPGQSETKVFRLHALRGATPGYIPVQARIEQADFSGEPVLQQFTLQLEEERADEVVLAGMDKPGHSMAKKNALKPGLSFDPQFVYESENKTFDEGEKISLNTVVKNAGPGRAVGVEVSLAGTGEMTTVLGAHGARQSLGDIEVGGERTAEFSGVLAKLPAESGDVIIQVRDARFAPLPGKTLHARFEPDLTRIPHYKTQKRSKAYAVVIGIEKYRDIKQPALYAESDARLVREYLIDALKVQDENIKLLINEQAGLADFQKYIENWLPDNVEKGSEVFFYYSGHGAPNPSGESFMVPYDADPANPQNNSYSLKNLYASLDKLQAKGIKGTLVILDSCFSGSGGAHSLLAHGTKAVFSSANDEFPGTGVVLSSSKGSQTSGVLDRKQHSLMTFYVLKGLQGEADADGNKRITLQELYDYLKPKVKSQARKDGGEQEPQLRLGEVGTLGIWAKEPLVNLAD